ncbi:MAG: 4'-phosphopantetheinyl transferase family protein, partial [Candidatus Hermodarchaeota archaeon]
QAKILIGKAMKVNSSRLIRRFLQNQSIWNKIELEEIEKRIKKTHISHFTEWILVRILAKWGVKLYLSKRIRLKNILLTKNSNNKPVLKIFTKDREHLLDELPYLSISHSKNYVFISLSSIPIGIDCELVSSRSNSWKNKVFSSQEIIRVDKHINKFKNFTLDTILTIMWSIKESTLKIIEGLTIGDIPDIKINTFSNQIITTISNYEKSYKNYFTVIDDTVLSLAL